MPNGWGRHRAAKKRASRSVAAKKSTVTHDSDLSSPRPTRRGAGSKKSSKKKRSKKATKKQ